MTERSRDDDELPVIRAAYEFILWLIPKIGKFPRDLRFTLGERIEREAFLILDLLLRAKYTRQRGQLLEDVNIELDVLRYQVRLAHDLKALSTKDYGKAAAGLIDVGQQIGGWRKQASHPGRTAVVDTPPK